MNNKPPNATVDDHCIIMWEISDLVVMLGKGNWDKKNKLPSQKGLGHRYVSHFFEIPCEAF